MDTGGLSKVIHGVNIVTILTTDHRITHVVGVDFNSLNPSVISSEPHKFIKYSGGKKKIDGSQTGKIRISDAAEGIGETVGSKPEQKENYGQIFRELQINAILIKSDSSITVQDLAKQRAGQTFVVEVVKIILLYRADEDSISDIKNIRIHKLYNRRSEQTLKEEKEIIWIIVFTKSSKNEIFWIRPPIPKISKAFVTWNRFKQITIFQQLILYTWRELINTESGQGNDENEGYTTTRKNYGIPHKQ
ncbi:MAG: hypothetical protein EZS28_008932 [Streblomastix strix]|uniref:Uncharacterized protein n=1 Tax=Streblomastix strix TaxID=222440 RepID=A0A5J4WKL7_9EUKA|nr:MAG: hypothetical protein EZS28_008932 [Streblomastix strix]